MLFLKQLARERYPPVPPSQGAGGEGLSTERGSLRTAGTVQSAPGGRATAGGEDGSGAADLGASLSDGTATLEVPVAS